MPKMRAIQRKRKNPNFRFLGDNKLVIDPVASSTNQLLSMLERWSVHYVMQEGRVTPWNVWWGCVAAIGLQERL